MFHAGNSLHAVVDKGLILRLSNEIELKLNCSSKQPSTNGGGTADFKRKEDQPLRLHQFICTAFRSELNVAENGAGVFIKNGVRVSAHHALLQGAIHLNGKCCKIGRTVLNPGDVVLLKLEPVEIESKGCLGQQSKLIAWQGSEAVGSKLDEEGKNISQRKRDVGKRKGRMMPVLDKPDAHSKMRSKTDSIISNSILSDTASLSPFIQYYRAKLASLWKPDTHESAMKSHLPLTIRVLKPTVGLDKELRSFGFRTVTESDFTLELCKGTDRMCSTKLDSLAVQELLTNTWIMKDEMIYQNDSIKKQQLGVFLSDARISGEILQQELNSMLPVSILAAILNRSESQSQRSNLRLLDLCSAPGSKTCQLLTTLNKSLLSDANGASKTDFTVVANELMPQRASRTRSRCFFQSNKSLSHLIVTAGDGRRYANMDKNYFDFILCDVPCSGDGTIRKSPEKLGKWSSTNAETNKLLQKELLTGGLDLLKPNTVKNPEGGVLLYSTCSLNPVENDEVVFEVLEEMNKSSLYKYEILNLGDLSCQDPAAQSSFLRVLPAASHGGFFVAAIMKSFIEDIDINTDLKNDNTMLSSGQDEMIWAHHEITGDQAICYSVSPSTRQCCTDLAKTVLRQPDDVQLIGCGVPVLFQSNKSAQCILQEGCCCMETFTYNPKNIVDIIVLTKAEFNNYSKEDSSQLLIPLETVTGANMDGKVNMTCIVKILVSDPSDEPTLLPAKVLNTDESERVVLEITARPQIMKRILRSII